MKFDQCWIGPSAGKIGCLALFWKNTTKIKVVSSSPNHIDATVGEISELQWRFTGIYGFVDKARKHETWSLIRDLHRRSPLPWVCAGDFNEIVWSHEKLGLGARPEGVMKEFRDALDECGLMDLGYVGEKFTWRGKRAGGMVLERLDKAVVDNGWFALYPGTKVQHLRTHSSDHKAILIKLEGIIPRSIRPFKFEQMWLCDEGCRNTILEVWEAAPLAVSLVQVASKIKICGEKLLEWSHRSFGSIKKQIETKGKQLSKAEINAAKGILEVDLVKVLKAKLNDLLDKESQMWQQRSRTLFLKCGDRNTSFFHSKASHRFRRNRITGLKNSNNIWCTGDNELKEIAHQYFSSLFTSSQPSAFSDILDAVLPSVTEDMNS